MNNIIQNELIESAKVGFFDSGLSRGTYGLQIKLARDKIQGGISSKVYEAVKTILEEPLPSANKKARIRIPEGFKNLAELRWLLAALKKFSISTQIMYDPSLGEPELLGLADWRILQVTAVEPSFVEFDELWFKPAGDLPPEFPLWPVNHPIYLYIDGTGRTVEELTGFMSRSRFPWVLL